MEYLSRYIPREYLALKINYCRKELEKLPVTTMIRFNTRGTTKEAIKTGKHRYLTDTTIGKHYISLRNQRAELERQLRVYESVWNYRYKDLPNAECTPRNINRVFYSDVNRSVILNKAFFDSLENDANDDHPKYKNYYFNGIYYRSAAEKEIAIFYTEMGIPFKYEPKVTLKGLAKPIHPDFVIYIKELDLCIFHEHLGMKDSSDYLRITKIKYGNYTNAGLVPDMDILFTHDLEDLPFDIRYLTAKLNTALYGLMICSTV